MKEKRLQMSLTCYYVDSESGEVLDCSPECKETIKNPPTFEIRADSDIELLRKGAANIAGLLAIGNSNENPLLNVNEEIKKLKTDLKTFL